MQYAFPPDVQQLITDQMASGHYANEDDVLRNALRALQEIADDAVAVQAAIDDWHDGDEGLLLDEAFAVVRADFPRKPPQ